MLDLRTSTFFTGKIRRSCLIISVGILVFVTICLPVEIVIIGHFLVSVLEIKMSSELPLRLGLASLAALPVWIIGTVLYVSIEKATLQEEAALEKRPSSPFRHSAFPSSDVVAIWQSCLEMQKHFNDLELRIRNFAVTLLVGVLSGAALSLKEHQVLRYGSQNLSLAIPVLSAGLFGWLAFYCMDRYWYHQLLVGAVRHAVEKIEEPFGDLLPLGITKRISFESPTHFWKLPKPIGARTHLIKIHSAQKVDLFYAAGMIVFVCLINAVALVAV